MLPKCYRNKIPNLKHIWVGWRLRARVLMRQMKTDGHAELHISSISVYFVFLEHSRVRFSLKLKRKVAYLSAEHIFKYATSPTKYYLLCREYKNYISLRVKFY